MSIDTQTTMKLTRRLRRLRHGETMRALVRETRLTPDVFMLPLFVCEGEGVRREVSSMPGVFNLSVDEAVKEARAAAGDGVRSVLLFGLPDHKDSVGSASYDPEAPVQSAIRAIKRELPGVLVATDVCLCEYTDHGHCGIVVDNEVVNDPTVEQLGTGRHVARDGRGRHHRAVRHDGRPRRGDPPGARRTRVRKHGHHGVCRQILVGVLRPVPRGRRFGAEVRRSAVIPDGSGERGRSPARGRTGHRGRRGHRHGEAGAPVPRCVVPREDHVQIPDGCVPGER